MQRRILVGSAVLILGLSGCSGEDGATAARSDLGQITMAQLAAQVADVQDAQQAPANQPVVGMTVANLQRLLQNQLIDAKAAELNVVVADSTVERAVTELATQNGGQAALEQAALQAGIGPAAIDDVVRSNLLVNEIGLKLDRDGTNDERLLAAQTALTELSSQVNVQIAPRFGAWNSSTLSISEVSVTSSLAPTPDPNIDTDPGTVTPEVTATPEDTATQ
ncbi:MAG: hypothetical protein ACOYEV_15705 [Candidatus Nanopelagicales bacterium]